MNCKGKIWMAKAGRPTKYKKEYCEKLIAHMGQGLSFESFAGVVDVDRDTVYHWLTLFPPFSDAKKKGTEKCRLFWEKMGIGLSAGKLKNGQAGVWVYNMKCRFSKEWRDNAETPTNVNINLSYNPDD